MPRKKRADHRNYDASNIGSRSTGASSKEQSLSIPSPRKSYIHTLPDDILLEIFSISSKVSTVAEDLWRGHNPIQYIMATVCHRWRDLILQTPLLWTTICLPNHNSFDTFKYFERSQPALIDVDFDPLFSLTEPEAELSIRFADAVATHASRLRRLTISVSDNQEMHTMSHRWKDQDAVNLESLAIFCHGLKLSHRHVRLPGFPSWTGRKFSGPLKLESSDLRVFGSLPNLTTLEVHSLSASPNEFQHLLNGFPRLNTFIIHQLMALTHTSSETQQQIEAPSLRSFAVNIKHHPSNCGCFLPFLSMKNLEYLEVAYLWSYPTDHHASIVSQWKNLPRLRTFRIYSFDIWMGDVSFLSQLPASINLEIIGFPKDAEPALADILNLSNLKSVTLDLSFQMAPEQSLDLQVFFHVVRRENPKIRVPVALRLPFSEEVRPDWLQLQAALGDKFSILVSPLENGLFSTDTVFAGEGPQDFDSDDDDFEEEELEEYDEFDLYDRDEIEYLYEDDAFDDDIDDDQFEDGNYFG